MFAAARRDCRAIIANVVNAEDAREIRMLPSAFDFSKAEGAGAGSSGVTGIQTIVLKGNPTKQELINSRKIFRNPNFSMR